MSVIKANVKYDWMIFFVHMCGYTSCVEWSLLLLLARILIQTTELDTDWTLIGEKLVIGITFTPITRFLPISVRCQSAIVRMRIRVYGKCAWLTLRRKPISQSEYCFRATYSNGNRNSSKLIHKESFNRLKFTLLEGYG